MDTVTLIGTLAACLTTGSFLPQAIKTIRSRDTRSISLLMYLAFTSGVLLWLIYGVLIHDLPVIVANAFTLAFSAIILTYKLRESVRQNEPA